MHALIISDANCKKRSKNRSTETKDILEIKVASDVSVHCVYAGVRQFVNWVTTLLSV